MSSALAYAAFNRNELYFDNHGSGVIPNKDLGISDPSFHEHIAMFQGEAPKMLGAALSHKSAGAKPSGASL